jgi:DNA repair protein RecO
MHHIYHTEGIILSSKNFGETGRYYSIFTKDLGMIYASAQGVRKMSSKLRFVLQDFAYVRVDLVQGKDFWRVTSATKTNLLETITKKPESFAIFSNIARLLKRLLSGVEPNEELFIDVFNSLCVLEKLEKKEEFKNMEVIIVLRILNNLGYIGGGDSIDSLIKSPFEVDLLMKASEYRHKVLSLINKTLKETHL